MVLPSAISMLTFAVRAMNLFSGKDICNCLKSKANPGSPSFLSDLLLPIACLVRPCLPKVWVRLGGLGKWQCQRQGGRLLGLNIVCPKNIKDYADDTIIDVDVVHSVGIDGDVNNQLLSLPERDMSLLRSICLGAKCWLGAKSLSESQ
jgi:hypothetical protein